MTNDSRDDGGPAFPQMKLAGDYTMEGLSLRDYFAAKALPSIIEKSASTVAMRETAAARNISVTEALAISAYELADAMLKARKQSA